MGAPSIHINHADRLAMGRRVRAARIRAGLTYAQLSAAMGVSAQTVADWQNGGRPDDAERRAKLCELLDVTEAELWAEYETALAAASTP